MRRSDVLKHGEGSAERVIAHAVWRTSRGRNPSMPFAGQLNPREALRLAGVVVYRSQQTKMTEKIGSILAKYKSFYDMTDLEIRTAARYIITSSSSEDEVRQRLRNEIDYPYEIDLHTTVPTDAIGRQMRELVRGLGGVVMKNGATAMATMNGHDSIIII